MSSVFTGFLSSEAVANKNSIVAILVEWPLYCTSVVHQSTISNSFKDAHWKKTL